MNNKNNNHTGNWLKGIGYELAFWNNVYRWKHTFEGMINWSHYGKVIQLEGFDANGFLSSADNPLVVDVGCGMSYATGNMMGTDEDLQPIDLHYVDPLAHYFNDILRRHHRCLPQIEFGMVEYLSAFYDERKADLIIIQNALDHSARPVKGIIEAVSSLRIGGILYLNHHPNEAETEHYKGFHQWNIDEEDGVLYIWNKQIKHSINDLLGSFADISVLRHDNGHVVAIITKTAEIPVDKLPDTQEDMRELCQLMMELQHDSSRPWRAMKKKMSYWRYNTIQFVAQALPWRLKMGVKKLIKQA